MACIASVNGRTMARRARCDTSTVSTVCSEFILNDYLEMGLDRTSTLIGESRFGLDI